MVMGSCGDACECFFWFLAAKGTGAAHRRFIGDPLGFTMQESLDVTFGRNSY